MPENPSKPKNLASLYRATVGPLRRYLARLLNDRTEAEDVAQDAFVRVQPVMARETVKNPEALLYTTARRLALNQIKRRRISPIAGNTADADGMGATNPGVVQQVMARQEWQNLEQAIAQLPEGCRTVLLLRKLEFLSHQEIAGRLGIAISTVEKQHARALRLLRAALVRQPAAEPPRATQVRT